MKKTRHKFVNIFCAILISTFVAGLLLPTLAAEATDEQLLVDKARITFESFMTDIFSFSRSKGAFAGLALDGAVVATRDKWNAAYYGKPASPVDILVKHSISNPGSAALRSTVAKAAK